MADFPGAGSWQASIWRDGPDADSDPTQLLKEILEINEGDSIHINMARGGGFVMILEPLD